MKVSDKIIVVTGGAGGIGEALCRRFAAEGARAIVVVDRDEGNAQRVAADIGALAIAADVGSEQELRRVVSVTEDRCGPIDLFCSNAGVAFSDGTGGTAASASDGHWQACWAVNVMAHVYAARAVLPGMIERGSGYLLNTASAAGLLNQINDAAYSTTKHAAVGFAEALAITHGDQGIGVSVLCPQYVATNMTATFEAMGMLEMDGVISPEQVADSVIEGLCEERFLILPHAIVQTYMERKVGDYDRWLGGMRKLRRKLQGEG